MLAVLDWVMLATLDRVMPATLDWVMPATLDWVMPATLDWTRFMCRHNLYWHVYCTSVHASSSSHCILTSTLYSGFTGRNLPGVKIGGGGGIIEGVGIGWKLECMSVGGGGGGNREGGH